MKKRWRAIGWFAGVVAVIGLMPAAVSAQAATQWRANLTGANEVPPTTSTGTGTFTATLDETAGTLAWTLSVPALTSITAAHLHAGAAGANGGVVLNLYVPAAGTTTNSLNLTGTARAADLSGSLANNFAGFVTQLKAGTIYTNVHTTANPGGEIRAQVTQVTATATATAAAPTAAPTAATTAAPTTTAATATAAATAAPAAPKTGNAGMAQNGGLGLGVAIVLALLTIGTVAGARMRVRSTRNS